MRIISLSTVRPHLRVWQTYDFYDLCHMSIEHTKKTDLLVVLAQGTEGVSCIKCLKRYRILNWWYGNENHK